MAHYDYRYNVLTIEEVDKIIQNKSKDIANFENRIKEMRLDLSCCKSEHSKEAIKTEIDYLEWNIIRPKREGIAKLCSKIHDNQNIEYDDTLF